MAANEPVMAVGGLAAAASGDACTAPIPTVTAVIAMAAMTSRPIRGRTPQPNCLIANPPALSFRPLRRRT